MAEKDQAKIEADLQKLETVIQKAKAAQRKFSTYTQKVFHLHAGPGR